MLRFLQGNFLYLKEVRIQWVGPSSANLQFKYKDFKIKAGSGIIDLLALGSGVVLVCVACQSVTFR